MKVRETLDEAIDRVATRMTRGGESLRVDIRPVWTGTSPAFAQALWRRRPVAVLVGVGAVLLTAIVIRAPRVDQHAADVSIAASLVTIWSPLHEPVSDERTDRGVEGPAGVVRRLRVGHTVDGERPAWGIPFITAPASLDVAASTTPAIGLETVAVEAINVEPLTIHAIDRDGPLFPKEQ